MHDERDLSFYIHFKYDSERDSLAEAFQILSEIIESFHRMDNNLLTLFDIEIKPSFVLEKLERGSIKAKIATVLRAIDDDALKELDWKKFIGSFLVKTKYRILKKLEEKNEISSIEEVKKIEEEIGELASETNIKVSIYPFPIHNFLKDLNILSKATSKLRLNEEILYIYSEGKAKINEKFKISEDAIELLLTSRTNVSEIDVTVRIKKPDYLGKSMWNVYLYRKACFVKILDYEWLNNFQERRIEVRPGDSLRVRLKTTTNFGYNNLEVSSVHEILKVYEVITTKVSEQIDLYNLLEDNPPYK